MIPQPTSRQVGVHPLPTPHLLWLAPSPLCGDNPRELSSSHHALSTWAIGEASLSPTGAVSRVADGTPKGIATHHLVNASLTLKAPRGVMTLLEVTGKFLELKQNKVLQAGNNF